MKMEYEVGWVQFTDTVGGIRNSEPVYISCVIADADTAQAAETVADTPKKALGVAACVCLASRLGTARPKASAKSADFLNFAIILSLDKLYLPDFIGKF